MLVMLLQVFLLFISSSLSSTPVPDYIATVSGAPHAPRNPTNLKDWLDNPKNMNMLWSLAKMALDNLPPPRNLEELENFLTTMGQIVSQKLALLKSLSAGQNPEVAKKLEALGPNPDKGVIMRLLNANSASHLDALLKGGDWRGGDKRGGATVGSDWMWRD